MTYPPGFRKWGGTSLHAELRARHEVCMHITSRMYFSCNKNCNSSWNLLYLNAVVCNGPLHASLHEEMSYMKITWGLYLLHVLLHVFVFYYKNWGTITCRLHVHYSITHILQQLHVLHALYICIILFTSVVEKWPFV